MVVSRGSTEPKPLFLAINDRFGLGLHARLTKPALAEAIAREAGVAWDGLCDSRQTASGGGSTVTLVGLERVLEACRRLVARAPQSHGVLSDDAPLEEELRKMLQVLTPALPGRLDGRDTVLQMRHEGLRWRDVEWPGFYIEFAARQALCERLGGDVGPQFGRTEFDYRLIRVFDIKVHSIGRSRDLWLNDVEAVEAAVLQAGGLGFVIVSGHPEFDHDGSFREWHQELKGEPSAYSVEREERGASPRMRKAGFEVTGVEIVFIDGIDALRRGQKDGWLRVKQQGRQSGGGMRRPKYGLVLSKIPDDVRVRLAA